MGFRSFITSVLCAFALVSVAQNTNLPTRSVNGKECYVYKVTQSEGFYSVSQKFGVTEEIIIQYNPSARNGLKVNQVLFIPVEESTINNQLLGEVSQPTESTTFVHTVKRGETLYAISRMYSVTVNDITALNPDAGKGLQVGQRLVIPQAGGAEVGARESTQVVTTPQAETIAATTTTAAATAVSSSSLTDVETSYRFHNIASGETLYSIARNYNVSVATIIRSNPGINPVNIPVGGVIRIPESIAQPMVAVAEVNADSLETAPTATVAVPAFEVYEVKSRETLYSIAQKFDVTIEELRKANPDVKVVSQGMTINIPCVAQAQDASTIEVSEDENYSVEQLEDLYAQIYGRNNHQEVNVALILPFMLNDESDSNATKASLYTEYYKGFLLAVDSLKRQGYSINVAAYDSEYSQDVVSSILEKPEMANVDLIITPDDDESINLIADFAELHNINVVNCFSMKNEKVETNSRMFQTNIPSSYMYAATVEYFMENFADRTVVFLDKGEDNEFVQLLKEELDRAGVKYMTCKYGNILKITDLNTVRNEKSVIFVPTSNKKNVPGQILTALEMFNERNQQCRISLFGYPSWIPQLNKNIDKLFALNTYVFSRFYVNTDMHKVYDFNVKYMYWYNEEMKNASPRYALLGFDTGMYFMKTIAENGRNFANYVSDATTDAMQTDFLFERTTNWSGFVNKSFYIIHLTTEMKIERLRQ